MTLVDGVDSMFATIHCRPIRNFFLLADDSNSSSTSQDTINIDNTTNKRKLNQLLPYHEYSPLAKAFGSLLKNMWSPHRFKFNVDPHMLVQAVSVASNKRFHVGKQAEAGEFTAWILHQLHLGVGGQQQQPGNKKKKKKKSGSSATSTPGTRSIIHETFMGKVEVTTITRRRKRRGHEAALRLIRERESQSADAASNLQQSLHEDDRAGSDDEETMNLKQQQREAVQTLADEIIYVEDETVTNTDFMQLTLDIPEKPLFKDQDGGLVIPQEPLVNVLRKFDGVSFCDVLAMQQQSKVTDSTSEGVAVSRKRRYRLKKLPNYLILHLNRFKHNNFTVEKNPTIVMFPVKNFDLSEYVFRDHKEKVPTVDEVKCMSVSS